MFTESFESGSLSGWTLSNAAGANNWTSSTTDPHTGTSHANANPRSTTEPAAVLQKAVSTTEYQSITFSYYRKLIGIDAGDEFQVEWFNGTTWTILESTGGASANDASYLYREFNLSIQANNNPLFQIKFECTAGATTEHCRIDNVNITGNLMPDTNAPNPSLLSPANASIIQTNLTFFNAHITDNRNATNTTLYVWNSTALIGTNSTTLGNSSVSVNLSFTLPRGGTYFWNYLAYDSSTNSAFNLTNLTLTFNPLSDLTPPNVTSPIPTQNSQFNLSQIIEVSADINDESSIDIIIANITLPNSTIYTLQLLLSTNNKYNNSFAIHPNLIGEYNITFIANDSLNNINSTEKTFFIANDVTAPIIKIIHPQNTTYTTTSLQINFTISDANLNSCWYTDNNGQTNTTLANCQNISYTAQQGSTAIKIYANDTSNNINSSSVTFFTDSIAPLITFAAPTELNNSLLSRRNVIINVTSIDVNLANITIFLLNSTLSIINQTTTANNNFINITNLADGTYHFNATAADNLNNKNSTETRTITIDSTPPLISFAYPTNTNNSILSQNSIFINTTITDANFANITFSLHNTTSLINQTIFTSQISSINFTSLPDEIYFYNVTIKDTLNNQNTTETRTITLDTIPPSINIISPQNITYFNTSILINISSNGNNIWFFNTTANETYTAPIYKTLEGSNIIIAYSNDSAGNTNSTSITFYATEINLNCEVGGPYQQGALVLVQGNLSNRTSPIPNQQMNISIYKNNLVNISKIFTTSNDGSFETSITNLSIGNYMLNVTTSYLQSNKSCIDNFQIGSQASLIISKIASIHNTTNDTIYYNITLKITNNGGADAINTNISDSDSESSPYTIGTLSPSSSHQISYLKNFSRQSPTSYHLTPIAAAYAIDSYSNSLLIVNSTEINLTIPQTQVGKQIIITKNILYISESSLNVTYNITSTLYNSGDEDLIDIIYIDTDINSIAIPLNLTKSSSKTLSNAKIIEKAASNTQHEFALGTAAISSLNFYSNRPKVNIPGYGGPADIIVYAPSSIPKSASFDSIIEIKNVNPDIGQDFPIDYWITNNEETQNSSSGQKTIYVGANNSINTTVTLTSPSTAGIYKLKALAAWAGGSASAFDSFEVTSTTETPQTPPSQSGSSSQDFSGSSIISPPTKKPLPEQEKTEEKQKEAEIICNPPYKRHGPECCLDQNNNNICDKDEKKEEPPKRENFFTLITGFITNNIIDIGKIKLFAPILIILISIILLTILIIKNKKDEKKNKSRLKNIINLKVFTTEGMEIGKIKEIYLENNKIHSIKVKLNEKKKFKAKGIIIPYKAVEAIKDIIIIKNKIMEKI